MELLRKMEDWEEAGTIGDGPEEAREAVRSGTWKALLALRYGLFCPTHPPPRPDPGSSDGPGLHPDPWDANQLHWRNYLFQHETRVSAWYFPQGSHWETVAAIGQALKAARAEGRRLRVIGGGQSASAVSKPDEAGHLLQLDACDFVEDPPYLPPGTATEELAWCGAGIRVVNLNRKLEARNQEMPNMGGYNGQTLAGALCTGTHGSGIGIPSLFGVIASIWVVVLAEDGEPELRIVEPTAGLSDPGLIPGLLPIRCRLWWDDTAFQAVCLGMGWLGVVFAMTLRVARRYWLCQTREMSSWKQASPHIDAWVRSHRTLELVLSPHPCWQQDGRFDHSCLVVRRDAVPPERVPAWPTACIMGLFDELLRRHPVEGTSIAEALEHLAGRRNLGAFLHRSLEDLQVRDFRSAVPNVLLLRYGNHARVKSSEILFRYADAIRGIEAVLRFLREQASAGRVATCPLGVRFIASTPGPLSPFDWGDGSATCSIEVPLFLHPDGRGWGRMAVEDFLDDLYAAVRHIPARLHWGQYHRMDRASLLAAYGAERVAAFERVWADFNPTGVTGNAVSDRLGFGGRTLQAR